MTLADTTTLKLICDMRSGRRVTVVSGTPADMREVFRVMQTYADSGEKIRRANGDEAILSADRTGTIGFTTAGRFDVYHRGLSADVVVFDVRPTEHLLFLAHAALAASPIREIVLKGW